MTLIWITVGLLRHTPIYGVAQEARIVIYITIGYFSALFIMRRETHLLGVTWVIILFGIGVALSEIWLLYSYSDRATQLNGCPNPCPANWGGGRWVRIMFADPPSEALLLASTLFVFFRRFIPWPFGLAL